MKLDEVRLTHEREEKKLLRDSIATHSYVEEHIEY
jgi:hypothetical protein